MSFSSLVSDIAYRKDADRGEDKVDQRSQLSRARSYASTTATSVSITGDIKSQLHGGYSHPLARSWQAERQLTKVGAPERPRFRACGS
jgi:porphobilinogen synthase